MKEFYEKVLPSHGVYCVAAIDPEGNITSRFEETSADVCQAVEELREKHVNVFVAPGSFNSHSRKANSCCLRSFFLDLDVGGDERKYHDKDEALQALARFTDDEGLPPPVKVDSGSGIHAYWIFEDDVPYEEWKPYAEKFKARCLSKIKIDPSVTADASRIMRCPDTLNYKSDPPKPTSLLDEEIYQYDFDAFKDYLGPVEPLVKDILAAIPKGIDEDTAALRRTNFETSFQLIAEKSLGGSGCEQVNYALRQPKTLSYYEWFYTLSLARNCTDWQDAIHLISNEYEGYNAKKTEWKANETLDKPTSCAEFAKNWPARCQGCPHQGKITNALALGRQLKEATPSPAAVNFTTSTVIPLPFSMPAGLKPFVRGKNGGIYYIPPPTVDKKGVSHQEDPVFLTAHDVYPIKRMFSPSDGECLMMRCHLPNDPTREFLLPLKSVYAEDRFKEIMTSNGALFEFTATRLFMNYINRWGQHLINANAAEQMRMQMGWIEGGNSFVVGNTEYHRDGTVAQTASSPFIRGIAKLLKISGSYDIWKKSANALNQPGFEIHAFTLMCGFGSPLMHMTSTAGAVLCLTGETGAAKTGALYGALSIFGQPKELSVFDATDAGMIGRYLGLHNIMLGCDEISNKRADQLSSLIHRISHGKAKIRMQASVNAERDLEMSASLLGVFTSNQSIYDKLTELKSSPDGEVARVVEIIIRKPELLQNNYEQGRMIFNEFNTNFGHAGPEFIKHYFKVGEDYVRSVIARWNHRFVTDFGGDAAYRFYENMISAVFAAGELANEAGIINYDLDRIYKSVINSVLSIREETIRVNFTDYGSLISEFINRHQDKILILDGSRVTAEPRGSLFARSEIDTQMIYIARTEMKKFLAELQVSSREFESKLKENGTLVYTGKQRLTTGWKAGIHLAPIAVYGFRYDLPNAVVEKILLDNPIQEKKK